MKKRIVKIFAMVFALLLLCGMISGCNSNQPNEEGKVQIRVGNWPTDASPVELQQREETKARFEAENPDIEIVPDTYTFSTDTFLVKASANQLPDMYCVPFTEIQKIIGQGFAQDITGVLEELEWKQYLNPEVATLVTDASNAIYAVPGELYAQGLAINKEIFKQAGLVNDDGTVQIPETLDEMAEFATIIKEKTGKAGFALPTTDNCGGWHFLNIAWDFGTEFMVKNDDGTYRATFDSAETQNALQYVKDLKWEYNALPENAVIDNAELRKIFATNQAGMIFLAPSSFSELVSQYGMPIDNIAVASMPEGPMGRYSQTGGNVWMFSKNCTPESVKAGLKWMEFLGMGPTISDTQLQTLEETYKTNRDEGRLVLGRDVFNTWENQETIEKKTQVASKYCNVDMKDYEHYFAFEGVQLKPEEPMCCQELYAVLDKCIQEVITNKNADVVSLIQEANNDFQVNHLDKAQ